MRIQEFRSSLGDNISRDSDFLLYLIYMISLLIFVINFTHTAIYCTLYLVLVGMTLYIIQIELVYGTNLCLI